MTGWGFADGAGTRAAAPACSVAQPHTNTACVAKTMALDCLVSRAWSKPEPQNAQYWPTHSQTRPQTANSGPKQPKTAEPTPKRPTTATKQPTNSARRPALTGNGGGLPLRRRPRLPSQANPFQTDPRHGPKRAKHAKTRLERHEIVSIIYRTSAKCNLAEFCLQKWVF